MGQKLISIFGLFCLASLAAPTAFSSSELQALFSSKDVTYKTPTKVTRKRQGDELEDSSLKKQGRFDSQEARQILALAQAAPPTPESKTTRSYARELIDQAGSDLEEAAMRHRRYTRLKDYFPTAEGFDRWLKAYEVIRANRERGLGSQTEATQAFGAEPNEQHFTAGISDRSGKKKSAITIPDGLGIDELGQTIIFEHKHKSGKKRVISDSQQFKAQRELALARGGRHVIVITSPCDPEDEKTCFYPSKPLQNSTSELRYIHASTADDWNVYRWNDGWILVEEAS